MPKIHCGLKPWRQVTSSRTFWLSHSNRVSIVGFIYPSIWSWWFPELEGSNRAQSVTTGIWGGHMDYTRKVRAWLTHMRGGRNWYNKCKRRDQERKERWWSRGNIELGTSELWSLINRTVSESLTSVSSTSAIDFNSSRAVDQKTT